MNEIILEISALFIAAFCLYDCIKHRRGLYFPLPKTWKERIGNQHFIYITLLIALMTSSVTSVSEVIFESYFNIRSTAVLYLINELYFISHNLLSFLFTLYIIDMTGVGKEKGRSFFLIFLSPCLVGEIFIVTTPLTHLIFYVNDEIKYVRGESMWILYAVAVVYILFGVFFFIKNRNRLNRMDRSATLILIFIAILGIVIQGVWAITVELFFEAICFLGFMLLLEDRRVKDRSGRSKKMNRNFIVVIAMIFLTVITININLIYHAGTDQTGKIGAIQLDNIKGNLQEMISESCENLLRFSMGMEQMLDSDDLEEIEAYIQKQKSYNYDLTGGNCFNVYASSDEWTIIPDFNMPEHYHAVERVWYIGALKSGDSIYITEPYVDAATGNLCFTLSNLLSDGKTVTAMDYNLGKIQDTVTEMSKYEEQTAMIVTEEGTIVGSSDDDVQGKKIDAAYPEFLEVFERVKASKEHGSFTINSGGRNNIVFSNETSNGWQLILIVDSTTFYADIYRQMVMLTAVDVLMVAVIIVFYMVSVNNQAKAEKTLSSAEGFISGLSEELKNPVNDIIKTSDKLLMGENVSSFDAAKEIRESGNRLKEMMDNLFSYARILKSQQDDNTGNAENKDKKRSVSTRYMRNGIIGILLIALLIGLILCLSTTTRWGTTRISKEADKYNGELTQWMVQHQSILRMFTDVIAADPSVLEDYDTAVKWLDDISRNYAEMSCCYMANPYNEEHPVIMNNGWVPPEGYVLEERQWYKDTERSGDGYSISAPYYDARSGLYCITFSRVVNSKSGDFLGIFAIDCYVDKLIDVLDDSYTSVGYAFLVDQDGNIINHPDKQYEMSDDSITNIEDTRYVDAYHDGNVFIMKDYENSYVSCYSEKSEISGFTVMVVQSWWSIYGTVLIMMLVFLIMTVVSIVAVALMISRFINWQEEANKKLVESADAAVSAGKAKSRFLAQMSHEIRTPINAVLGMNEMILRESSNDSIREYAASIASAGRNLLSLINSILDFSKIEEGKMEIIPVRYDTAVAIGNVVYSIEHRAVDKGLKFETHIDTSLPSVLFGDDMRVSQVVTNLLTNAVKYTNEGRVDLYVSGIRRTEDKVSINIRVKDTGIGIKEEDLGKLFESFTRLEETRNRNIEGTGLGMAIVTKLLEMMGSRLDVKSEYGKGSEFSFVVDQVIVDPSPMGDFRQKARDAMEKQNEEIYIVAENAKILAVDDNEMNLKVIRNLLKLSGINPDLATSGEEALKKLSENHYHIVLLDHMMPHMDGIETLQKARSMDLIPKGTTVIALTANAVVGARDTYLDAGFDDYLSKPVEIKTLEQTLAKYLPKDIVEYKKKDEAEGEDGKKDSNGRISAGKKDKKADEDVVLEFLPGDFSDEEQDDNEASDTLRDLNNLEKHGINISEGVNYCGGDTAFYIEIVTEYAENVENRLSELEEAMKKQDWNLYAVKVHALKSMAKTIGDAKVFEKAKALEAASKENDAGYVRKNHVELAMEYKQTSAYIMGEFL